jgi:hypothetical protein
MSGEKKKLAALACYSVAFLTATPCVWYPKKMDGMD